MRISYGITGALLAGGAAITLATGFPAGAQVAQNENMQLGDAVPRNGAPASFADLTEALQPAVVNISTRQRITLPNNPFQGTPFADLFGREGSPTTREAQSLGSGFIVSPDGYVVTNSHVVAPDQRAQLEEVTVTMPDGTEYPAELIGRDADSDLAVLKIERGQPFPFVRFGDSAQARVGDWVIAIGNPFGLGGTVTSGIVSAVLRSTGGGAYDRYIQTDASINRGNSGGPLFDMQGNVIGINNAIISPTGGSVGIGFAIPAESAAPIVRSLIAGEEIVRGYLGVQIQPVTEDFADALGLEDRRGEFIQSVQPGEPAERAGLQSGDVVVEVNGEEVTSDQTLSYLVANIRPGTTVPVEFIRDGRRRTADVTVGRRPTPEELAAQSFNPDEQVPEAMAENNGSGLATEALGLQLTPLTPRIAGQLGVSGETGGLVVTAVDPTSDAATKGIGRGVIVLQANGVPVTSRDELDDQIRQAQSAGREAILLRLRARNGPAQSLPIRLR